MNPRPLYGGSQLPLYQSTKRVRATRIEAFVHLVTGCVAHPADKSLNPIELPPGYAQRFQPVPGGYYVVHANGDANFMLCAEFESNYSTVAELVDRRASLEQQLSHVNAAITASEKT